MTADAYASFSQHVLAAMAVAQVPAPALAADPNCRPWPTTL